MLHETVDFLWRNQTELLSALLSMVVYEVVCRRSSAASRVSSLVDEVRRTVMTERRQTLVLDFDGVLHSYVSPWASATVVPDPPVEGAREFLLEALETFDVAVVSSRSHELGGVEAMARYVADEFGGQLVMVANEPHVVFGERAVTFPLHKPPAFLTIDDRALTFTGTWPSVDELTKFKPWNRR